MLSQSDDIPFNDLKLANQVSLFIGGLSGFWGSLFVYHYIAAGHHHIASSIFIFISSAYYVAWRSWRNNYAAWPIYALMLPTAVVMIVLVMLEIGAIGALWAYPLLFGVFLMLQRQIALITVSLFAIVIVAAAWLIITPAEALRLSITLLTSLMVLTFYQRLIVKQHKQLQTAATIDPLTGLYNRANLHSNLTLAYENYRQQQTPVTLLVIDVDHFKSINDEYGHAVGDQVLEKIAKTFKKSFRGEDKIFRVGGEEFIVILSNIEATQAEHIAQRINAQIKSLSILPDRLITVSIGITHLRANDDVDQWLERGDQHLYQAKSNGRDRCVA